LSVTRRSLVKRTIAVLLDIASMYTRTGTTNA
jgi:hypothetical protein